MNTKQAKQLDFPTLLEKMGHQPVANGIKKGGRELWYRSPLSASDKTASFHLTKGKQVAWVFKCFSTGNGGTVIDFVIAHEGYAAHDVPAALAFLRDKFPGALFDHQTGRAGGMPKPTPLFSFHQQGGILGNGKVDAYAADKSLQYLEDLPLKSGRLLSYLEESRKIPAHIAQKHLRLVRYKNLKSGKTYYAIGMRNIAPEGGFEIRAASDSYKFKSALIARHISVIRAATPSDAVMVYEGFMDFLSHLAMMGRDEPPCDCIVMHSVNSFRRAATFIDGVGYRRICTLLDADGPGQKCTEQFESEFPGRAVSYSHFLHPFKDVNECLQRNKRLPPFDHLSDVRSDLTPN